MNRFASFSLNIDLTKKRKTNGSRSKIFNLKISLWSGLYKMVIIIIFLKFQEIIPHQFHPHLISGQCSTMIDDAPPVIWPNTPPPAVQ